MNRDVTFLVDLPQLGTLVSVQGVGANDWYVDPFFFEDNESVYLVHVTECYQCSCLEDVGYRGGGTIGLHVLVEYDPENPPCHGAGTEVIQVASGPQVDVGDGNLIANTGLIGCTLGHEIEAVKDNPG